VLEGIVSRWGQNSKGWSRIRTIFDGSSSHYSLQPEVRIMGLRRAHRISNSLRRLRVRQQEANPWEPLAFPEERFTLLQEYPTINNPRSTSRIDCVLKLQACPSTIVGTYTSSTTRPAPYVVFSSRQPPPCCQEISIVHWYEFRLVLCKGYTIQRWRIRRDSGPSCSTLKVFHPITALVRSSTLNW
jgi:hypothetical protein